MMETALQKALEGRGLALLGKCGTGRISPSSPSLALCPHMAPAFEAGVLPLLQCLMVLSGSLRLSGIRCGPE